MLTRYCAFALLLTSWGATQPTWTQRNSANNPGPRKRHAMAFDDHRQLAVIFGGALANLTPLGDTWEWDGNNWFRVSATGPGARREHAMVYDAARRQTILFGGFNGTTNVGDTWAWDGIEWRQRSTTGPSARRHHRMAYDSHRQRVVLFGGWGTASLNDTWEWDGGSWVQMTSVSVPTARHAHAMSYDSIRRQVVLFGGASGSQPAALADTWGWNGTDWAQTSPTPAPRPRHGHAMTFDASRGVTVLFSGWGGSNVRHLPDSWEWDGAAWTQVGTRTTPPAREHHTVAYDVGRQRVLLFGGANSTSDPLADTWEYGDPAASTSTLSGSVTIAGLPASGVPVEFVSSNGNAGPFFSDAAGNYTLILDHPRIPQNVVGNVRARLEGRTIYYTARPVSANSTPTDLDVTATTQTGVNVNVPRPVVLVHGILSNGSRWDPTVAEFAKDLKTRLVAQPPLAPSQALITHAVDYDWLQSNNACAARVDADIMTFRHRIALTYRIPFYFPIDVVAHSKGGLVARAYINSAAVQQGEVAKLITLGTPHGGALLVGQLPPAASLGLHPYDIWGFDPWTGARGSTSFGETVTDLKGATMCVVGSSIASGNVLISSLPWFIRHVQAPYFPWGWMITGQQFNGQLLKDDLVVTTWSSVVFPVDRAPDSVRRQVRGTAEVADSHFALPSPLTLEIHLIPWLR